MASLVAAGIAVNKTQIAIKSERAAQKARKSAEEQLEFSQHVLNDQFAMRDQLADNPRSLLAMRVFFGFDRVERPANSLPLAKQNFDLSPCQSFNTCAGDGALCRVRRSRSIDS